MNRVILLGRLTNEPKIASTSNGIASCQFTLAVNRDYKNKEGNYDADFINCIAFRNTAEFIGKFYKKGSKIAVEGQVHTRNYEDKDKKKVYVTEILVERTTPIETKKQDNTQNNIQVPEKTKTEYDNDNSDIELTDEEIDKVFNNEQLDLPF